MKLFAFSIVFLFHIQASAQVIFFDSTSYASMNFEIHSPNTYSYSVNGVFFDKKIIFEDLFFGVGFPVISYKSRDEYNKNKNNASLFQFPYFFLGAFLALASEGTENKDNKLLSTLFNIFWIPNSQLHYSFFGSLEKKQIMTIYIKSSIDYFFFQNNDYLAIYPGIGLSYLTPNFAIKLGYEKVINSYSDIDNSIFLTFAYNLVKQ